MILTNLQQYIATHKKVSLEDLSNHFQYDPEALRPMLNRLIKKGRICQQKSEKCHGCTHCSPESIELYEWINYHNNRDSFECRNDKRNPCNGNSRNGNSRNLKYRRTSKRKK
ncbi:FeoC-like transcriptional regulator [Spirulina sp. CS-785/01]|uniref:FeoC-like transcriptional regulator n=1 Tax=Spirulina sp. CS-785/01 TaxID=3021716 RepID=UPI003FA7DF17